MDERKKRRERVPSRAEYVVSIVVTSLLLMAMHLHEIWRPWLGGVVTAEWVDVLWSVDVSMGTQIAGAVLLFFANPPVLRRLVDLANAVVGALSVSVTLAVYPFAFSRIVLGLDVLVHLALVLALIGVTIAIVVNLVRFLAAPWAREPEAAG